MSFPYLVWPILASLIIAGMEVLFRRADHYQLWWVAPAIALNYLLFRTFQGASSLLVGALITSLGIVLTRSLASQFLLGETVTRGNLVAALVLAVGAVVAILWR